MNKHFDIIWTSQFKKDYKLANSEPLPEKNKDHALTGNWFGQERTAICSESKKMHSVSAGCISFSTGTEKVLAIYTAGNFCCVICENFI